MFEIKTQYTFEEYKRYVYDTNTARSKFAPDIGRQASAAPSAVRLVYYICCTMFFVWAAIKYEDVLFAVMGGCFVGLFIFSGSVVVRGARSFKKKSIGAVDHELRRVWESDKLTRDAVVTFTFGEDSFDARFPNSDAHIGYSDICFLTETPTNFYIMTSLSKGYIISKENTNKEQRMFIRAHCGANGSVNVDI